MASVSSPSLCSACWSFNSEFDTRSPILSLPYARACAHARLSPLSCGPTAWTTSGVSDGVTKEATPVIGIQRPLQSLIIEFAACLVESTLIIVFP